MIDKDQNARVEDNFNPLIISIQQRFNMWLQRDLSLSGRSLVAKVEGLSRVIYTALALDVPSDLCTKIDKLVLNFIWKNKSHYIKKGVMMNKLCSGGLAVLDFSSLNATFKVKWIKQYFKNKFFF